MANPAFSTALRSARVNAIKTAVGSAGKLLIYDGTRPASGGSATNLLATFTMGSPFSDDSTDGVLTGTLPDAVNASATGTGAWARLVTSGDVFVADYDVATTGATAIVFNSVAFVSGVSCQILSFIQTDGNA